MTSLPEPIHQLLAALNKLPGGKTRMYVGDGNTSDAGANRARFWRTDDAAGAAVFTDMTTAQNIGYCTAQCWYDNVVYSPPGAPDVVYLAGYGFPRYRDKADVLSALVNKALKARGLRPEKGQSLYSLRHTFEDRLTAVDAPDKIIAGPASGQSATAPLQPAGKRSMSAAEFLRGLR